MSFDDAVAALEGAIDTDSGVASTITPTPTPTEQAPTPLPTSQGATPQVQPHHAQNQPRDPASGKFIQPDGTLTDTPTPAPNADTFDGGQFNPDQLPPELQPAWKQLQTAYVRKTQEIAAERQQFEGLDPALAREAVELYQALQDPNYLVQFHSELSQALEARGLSPAQASAEAARQIEGAGKPATSLSDQLAALRDDPELAPLAESVSALQQRLESMETEAATRAEHERQAQWQMAMAGELTRQEMAIRQSNPAYGDADVDIVTELSAFHDGNLLQAQSRLEQYVQSRIARYLDQKQTVEPGVGPVPGGGLSTTPVQVETLDDAFRAAQAHLAAAGIDRIG